MNSPRGRILAITTDAAACWHTGQVQPVSINERLESFSVWSHKSQAPQYWTGRVFRFQTLLNLLLRICLPAPCRDVRLVRPPINPVYIPYLIIDMAEMLNSLYPHVSHLWWVSLIKAQSGIIVLWAFFYYLNFRKRQAEDYELRSNFALQGCPMGGKGGLFHL